ncbi:MAG: hypothetical protein PHQ36_05345 [Anaerolineales bacterium]|nr:hypothetical protein [Anaerolineales bacterium]
MKTLFRILVILVVASLIGGVIFALVNMNDSASQQRSAFQRPEGERHRPEGGDRDRLGGSIFLPFGMIKNLAVISIIAAIYLNVGKLFAGKKSSKQVNT